MSEPKKHDGRDVYEFFLKYLRARRIGIIAYAVCCAIFALTFALYRLPVMAVLYPLLLSAIISACAVACSFSRALDRHRRLCEIKKLTAATLSELPPLTYDTDEDYADIIEMLRREAIVTGERALGQHRDTVDYYTVWAHQIKTPIASMRLTLSGEDSDLSRRLSSELSRIEQYVEMVLAYLRLDSESGDYVFREYDLDAIVRRSVRRFSGDFITKKLRLEYSPILKKIVTDEKWLSFVIEQVLSNALKYTRRGSVSIRTPRRTFPTARCHISGVGILRYAPTPPKKLFPPITPRRSPRSSPMALSKHGASAVPCPSQRASTTFR